MRDADAFRSDRPLRHTIDGTKVEELRAIGVTIEGEPHVIFTHDDDTLGPAGTDEWIAFIRDSEGNLVGLVSHSPSEQ